MLRSSAPARPDWLAPNSSSASAIWSLSSSVPTVSVGCCGMESPISRWKSGSSTDDSNRWKAEGVVFRPSTDIGVDVSAQELLSCASTPSAFAAVRSQPRDLPIEGARPGGGHVRHDVPDRAKPPRSGRLRLTIKTLSRPAASMSSSSAAVTPAPIVSEPFIGRSARAFISLRSCLDRLTTGPPPTRGPSGPTSSARRRPTKKEACANSRS